jgi:hypothetical protein
MYFQLLYIVLGVDSCLATTELWKKKAYEFIVHHIVLFDSHL